METTKRRRGALARPAVLWLCALLGCSADHDPRRAPSTAGGMTSRSSEPAEGASHAGAPARGAGDASVTAQGAGIASPMTGGNGANASDAAAHAGAGAAAPVGGDAAATSPADASQDGSSVAIGVPADERYSVLICPGTMPMAASFDQFPGCDGEIKCGEQAHCIPADRLPAKQIERMPDCSAGKCVPDHISIIRRFRFKACEGELGAGRCIPLCFALVANRLSNLLARGDFGCGKEEVCAPCASPADGTSTGACDNDPCAE